MKNFNLIDCITCGVDFYIPTGLDVKLQETRNTFFCPNGHRMSYTESTADQLRKQLETKDRELTAKFSTIISKNNLITVLEGKLARAERKIKRLTKDKK